MADVLLIYPKAGHDLRRVSVTAPLTLLTIAAPLVKDYSVRILDQRTSDTFWEDLAFELKQNPIVVGLGSMTGTQIYYSLEVTKFIKERSTVPVVWGGMHATLEGSQTIAKPYIDFVIRGEGEESFQALTHLIAKHSTSYEEVPGLLWKRKGQIFGTAMGDPIDLDTSPKLPWQLLDVEEYISPSQYAYSGISRLLPFQGSRGCPFKCTFCSEPVLTKKFRMMNAQKIVDECLETAQKFKLDHIVFYDEEFFVNRKWATAIAQAINGQFTWTAQTRAADLLRVDLPMMERCGLQVLAPGLESGSDRMLKYMKKGETIAEYKEANRRLSETGIRLQYNFIVGFPTETKKEVVESVDLILHLLTSNKNATVNQFSPLTPLPGTELLRQVTEHFGFQMPKRLEDWVLMTRGKQERPWISKSRLRLIRFLYYSSLFLCTERHAEKFKVPQWIWKFYGKTIRLRWKMRLFWLDWEMPLVRLIFRFKVNPIDYTFKETYGDNFTAKESDIKNVVRSLKKGAGAELNVFIPPPIQTELQPALPN